MDPMMGKAHDPNYDWNAMHEYASHLSSPAQEYGSFAFGAVPGHELPQDHQFNRPMYSMPAQQPQPVFPAQWPSLLTNPSMHHLPHHPHHQQHPQHPSQHLQHHIQAPPDSHMQLHQVPGATPLAPTTMQPPRPPPLDTTTQPRNPPQRRTLTDNDRKKMCLYHENNPSVKQTEIGAMFGVERSTVSKVLRHKDKYLASEDGNRSPVSRKTKGKFPDVERALSNWMRNHERKGVTPSDQEIRQKAQYFATSVGSTDSLDKLNSKTWLEKFKQKNRLISKARKFSDANESDIGSGNVSGSQTPSGISPTSPSGVPSPSPTSPSQVTAKLKMEHADMKLETSPQPYNSMHSLSATSLVSDHSDSPAQATSSFNFEVGSSHHGLTRTQTQLVMNQANANSHRGRSQTYPVLGIDASFIPGNNDLTPEQMQDLMANATLETPVEDYGSQNLVQNHIENGGLALHIGNSQSPTHDQSPVIMGPPVGHLSRSATGSAISSPIVPPSQDEARKALELVMSFFQHQPAGVVDAEEYITMGKLMEKLKGHGPVGELPGGMHSIDFGHQDLSRKRSINSL